MHIASNLDQLKESGFKEIRAPCLAHARKKLLTLSPELETTSRSTFEKFSLSLSLFVTLESLENGMFIHLKDRITKREMWCIHSMTLCFVSTYSVSLSLLKGELDQDQACMLSHIYQHNNSLDFEFTNKVIQSTYQMIYKQRAYNSGANDPLLMVFNLFDRCTEVIADCHVI